MLQATAVALLHHLWPVYARLVLPGKESISMELPLDGYRMKWEGWESHSSQFLIEPEVLSVLL